MTTDTQTGIENGLNTGFYISKWQVMPNDCSLLDGDKRIKLEPKAMDLLLVLAKANGDVVSRDDIFASVWKNQIIADHVLYNLIANLRKVMESDHHKPKIIITVPKKGYKLGLQVKLVEKPPAFSKQNSDEKVKQNQPHKNAKTLWLNIVAGICIFGLMAYWINTPKHTPKHTPNQHKPSTEVPMQPIIALEQTSIAVLPFDVYDEQLDTRYFADGLAEEIIHSLTTIPDLAVVSRTSSFAFRNQNLDIQAIASKLNSQYVLEGSVRRSSEKLRVTIQLIKAKTGTHLWSSVFDVSEQDLLKLQQDISHSIIQSLLPDYKQNAISNIRIHPSNSDAYLHYLRGNAMASKGTVEGARLAIEELHKAISLAPDYALAHTAIALNTMILFQYRQLSPEQAREPTVNAINKALEIDPYMALAHAAEGLMHVNYGDNDYAVTSFKRALELDPTLAIAHHNYGYLLWIQDRHEQALAHFKIALARNPMSTISNFAVADSLFVLGQLKEALKQYQHCISLFPNYPACHLGIANFYRSTLQNSMAVEHMQLANSLLDEKNIYRISASLMDSIWQANFVQATTIAEQLNGHRGGGYSELQAKALIYLHDDNLSAWIDLLKDKNKRWPGNAAIDISLGLAYFWQSNCESSLMHYNKVLNEQTLLYGKFNTIAWGVSHLTNMAQCYQKEDLSQEFDKVIKLVIEQLNTFEVDTNKVPGLLLTIARKHMLLGNNDQAKLALDELEKLNWPLYELLIAANRVSQ